MSATYDEGLATDRDWVRFLIGDTDAANAEVSDEEIDAMLTRYPVPACAAVQVLQSLVARSNRAGGTSGPIASKSADGLSVSYATASKGMTRGDLLDRLRKECARRSGTRSIFNTHGPGDLVRGY